MLCLCQVHIIRFYNLHCIPVCCIFNGLITILLIFLGKDKIQAKSHLSKARSPRQNLAEDSEIEKQESSPLMECKSYLRSIFVHWEPLIPISEPQLVNSLQGLAPSPLVSDAAQLLSKWCLRCLVEESYDENRTKEFLFWAKKIVLEDKEIMNALLDDSGWRADLLRLHHHTDVYCHSSVPSRVETLQIFTDVMICLLEAKVNLPVLHHAVMSACLSNSKQDQSRYGESLPPNSCISTVPFNCSRTS